MSDDLFSDAVAQLLSDQCTPAVVRAIEAGGEHHSLWQHIEFAGFADALLPEDKGGAGMSLADVYPIWALCGAHALPVPLAETMLCRALLAAAGITAPKGSLTLATGTLNAQGTLTCDTVRCGRVADHVLAVLPDRLLVLPTAKATATDAGFCLDATLQWSAADVAAAPSAQGTLDVRTLQACLYSAQLAGALESVFQRTLAYANDRNQFGRPIGKFQAIQHQLSVMAEHVFAARMAAQLGCHSDQGIQLNRQRVAVAKARTSEAALEVASLAHSIHGAIGFTAEFDLQLYTRRLHLWRQAAGSETYWHGVLGAALLDAPDTTTLDLIRRITDTATV
jgi:acyl-CoA dehydrogenase